MKKGEIYEGVVERIDFPNKGRVHVEGETVTVKNAIPGQKIRFQINKKRKNRMEGRLLEVTEKSPMEKRDPVCSIFPSCGGCMYQTMSYEESGKKLQLPRNTLQGTEYLRSLICSDQRSSELHWKYHLPD